MFLPIKSSTGFQNYKLCEEPAFRTSVSFFFLSLLCDSLYAHHTKDTTAVCEHIKYFNANVTTVFQTITFVTSI
jgi:hypothetical protein